MRFTQEELKERAFIRAATALFSHWEERADDEPKSARAHSRLFETLIYDGHIQINKKTQNLSYREHVVPCAYIRDHAFQMFSKGKTITEVATMISRLLHIAYITKDEAKRLNSIHKYDMPKEWNPDIDCILSRLEIAKIPKEHLSLCTCST